MKAGLLKRTLAFTLSMLVLVSSVSGNTVMVAANTNEGLVQEYAEETVASEATETTEATTGEETENVTDTVTTTEDVESTEDVAVEETEVVESTEDIVVEETEDVESTEDIVVEETEDVESTEDIVVEETEVVESTEDIVVEETEDVESTEDIVVESTEETELEEETEELEVEELEVEKELRGATATTGGTAISAAKSVSVNTTYTSTFTGNKEFYSFKLSQPGMVTLNVKNTTGVGDYYVYFNVDKATASTYMYNDYIEGSEAFVGLKVGLAADTYYFYIDGLSSAKGSAYQFSVNYTASNTWETEYNDTISTSDTIAVNTAISGTAYRSTDDDYFQFTLSQPGVVTLQLDHEILSGRESTNSYEVRLYNSIGGSSIYYFSSMGGETTKKSCEIGLPAGTYYVLVDPSIYALNPYTFKVNYTQSAYWEQEVNDTATLATGINVNTQYSGTSMNGYEYDYYKFTTSANGLVSLNFTHANIPGEETSNCYTVKLYGDAALQNELYSFQSKGADKSVTSPTMGLPKGTYYVRVSGYKGVTYGLKVNHKASSTCELEMNETVATATTIQSGKTYTGSTKDYNDQDYYKIVVKDNGYVTLNLKHSANTTNNVYNIAMWNAQNLEQTVYYSVINGSENNFTTCKIGLAKGTYYIRVRDSNLYTGDYQLKVTATKASNWESEINDNTSTADKITVGKAIKATSDRDDMYDYYKFTLSSATYINISITHDEINGTQTMYSADLYDSKGNYASLYMYSHQGEAYSESKTVKLAKGTYYVKVYGGYAAAEDEEYTLTVNKVKKVTPTISSVKSAGDNKMTVTWKAVPGATKYEIYRSTSKNGSYKKVKTVSEVGTTSWTDKGVKTGKTYYYKMKATVKTNETLTSGYSKVKYAKVVPATPTLSSVKSSSSKQAVIKWKKVSGATGYEVYRATSKNGNYTKVTTINKGSTVSYTNKNLSSGKTYYYKVRAYKTVSGKKVYSSYSTVKSVKVK